MKPFRNKQTVNNPEWGGWNLMRTLVAAAAACSILIGLSHAQNSQASIRKTISIPAQDLSTALQSFAQERKLYLIYADVDVSSRHTGGASGELTQDEVLRQLLKNTGLTFRYLDANTVSMLPLAAVPASSTKSLATWDGGPFRLAQAVSPSQSSSSGEDSLRVEEIIVTATKRAERLQDVPISITAITADDIDRRGLVNAEDYLRGTPGVNQVDAGGGGGQAIVIRGLETSPSYQNNFSGATVATYFGETPTTGSATLTGGANVDIKLVDIERVEVLRGPQGTAFGSSAMAGVVRTIPVAPKLDTSEGKVAAGYSNTSGAGGGNYNVQAIGNIPLITDKLAVRAAVYKYEDSGLYSNRAGSDAAFQSAVVARYGAQAFAADQDEVGSASVVVGRIAALFQANDDLRLTVSYLKQQADTDGWPVQTSGRYEQTVLQVAPEHVIRGQKLGVSDTDLDIANAVLEYKLSWADLLATYSYLDGGFARVYPFTSFLLNSPVSSGQAGDYHRAHTGEVRLTTQLDGPWNFLTGLYAEQGKDLYDYTLYWHGDPATDFYAPGQRFLGHNTDRQDLRQQAAFGEASWRFLPKATLAAGVRYYNYDRTFRHDTTGPLLGTISTTKNASASGTTFRSNLSYKPVDDVLLYAGFSQGFRLGKPQTIAPGLCDFDRDGTIDGTNSQLASAEHVESDSADNYELGAKVVTLGRRLTIDAALYRMNWSDIPVTVRPIIGCSYIVSAGAARTEGFEFQANFQVSEAIRIDFGGSRLRARLTQDVPAQGFHAGDRLPGSPKANANLGMQYAFDILGQPAFVRADAIYVGAFHGDVLQTAILEAGDYTKVDASARIEVGRLNISLYVHNLTNEDAFTYRGAAVRGPLFGYRLRPRTIGFQLGYAL